MISPQAARRRPGASTLPDSERHPSRRALARGPSQHGNIETSSQRRERKTSEVQRRASSVVPNSRLGLPSCRALWTSPFAIVPKNPENRPMPHNASTSRIVRHPTLVCSSIGSALASSARRLRLYCLKRHIDWVTHRDQPLASPAKTCTPTTAANSLTTGLVRYPKELDCQWALPRQEHHADAERAAAVPERLPQAAQLEYARP